MATPPTKDSDTGSKPGFGNTLLPVGNRPRSWGSITESSSPLVTPRFGVVGSQDAASLAAASQAAPQSLPPKFVRTPLASANTLCERCETNKASFLCEQCDGTALCASCNATLHSSGRWKQHVPISMEEEDTNEMQAQEAAERYRCLSQGVDQLRAFSNQLETLSKKVSDMCGSLVQSVQLKVADLRTALARREDLLLKAARSSASIKQTQILTHRDQIKLELARIDDERNALISHWGEAELKARGAALDESSAAAGGRTGHMSASNTLVMRVPCVDIDFPQFCHTESVRHAIERLELSSVPPVRSPTSSPTFGPAQPPGLSPSPRASPTLLPYSPPLQQQQQQQQQ
eukprot:gnl/Spiro4/18739_TR10016_c0_g1_i1.p1 gnl/Spiro4/18739_TR10016_c0_g1~~gnl/Spiro4/18739_TR10016_c0_g1_i1.p1  ORF type:complete len:367 (+),score=76.85 gnl/Spiro4/18739_TR10016_c0_g1_i1:62-1102(+)